MIEITPAIADYLTEIVARAHDAVTVDRHEVVFQDGTRPLVAHCHDNVDRWVRENPESSAVRGWVVISTSCEAVYIAAHSVVRTSHGCLIDLTPLPPDQATPFIIHEGDHDVFLKVRCLISNIWWPLRTV
jgi:hypothetical protein